MLFVVSHGANRVDETIDVRDEPATPDELLEWAATHAESVSIPVELDSITWKISHRAKRRAGACQFDRKSGEIVIRLTWAAYQAFGWEKFSGVVRHELVHAYEFQTRGQSDHGSSFRTLAHQVDAPYRCERFTPPKFWVECVDCGDRLARYKRSKLVKQPERYRCGGCGGTLVVERNDDP